MGTTASFITISSLVVTGLLFVPAIISMVHESIKYNKMLSLTEINSVINDLKRFELIAPKQKSLYDSIIDELERMLSEIKQTDKWKNMYDLEQIVIENQVKEAIKAFHDEKNMYSVAISRGRDLVIYSQNDGADEDGLLERRRRYFASLQKIENHESKTENKLAVEKMTSLKQNALAPFNGIDAHSNSLDEYIASKGE